MIQTRRDFSFGEAGARGCAPATRATRVVIGGWPARGVVYERDGLAVGYTRCRPTHDGEGHEIHSGHHTLAFPTRGVFRMHVGGGSHVCDPNHVVLQNADDVFRTSHPEALGDDTIWITYAHERVMAAVRPHDPDAEARPGTPFPRTIAPSDARTFVLVRSMFNDACLGPDADAVRIERAAAAILASAVASAFERAAATRPGPRRATAHAHAAMAESAKAYLAAHPERRITIDDLARRLHSSPFHLCRLFRRHTGAPIHRYLSGLRLRAALDRLHEHRSELGALAAELGFASHSHFCDAFRREFGETPSAMRHRLLGRGGHAGAAD